MGVLQLNKSQTVSGSNLSAIFVGETFAGNVSVQITKSIVFSYDVAEGNPTTEDAASEGACYVITRQQFTLNWSATITETDVKTVTSLVTIVAQSVGGFLEKAGASIAGVGGALAFWGMASPPTAPVTTGTGGLIAAGGAVVAGVGKGIDFLASSEVTTTTRTYPKSGSLDFATVGVEQVECLPEHTYSSSAIPDVVTYNQALSAAITSAEDSL
jgi:hypothetical protein